MRNLSARQFFAEGSGIATLCGSTRYFPQCMKANYELTLQNWIVLMCGIFGHSYHKDSQPRAEEYALIKKLHFQKILESNAIVVVSDSSGYYGESTTEEIAFAQYRQIPVFYFDGENFSGWEIVERVPDRYADTSLIDSFRLTLGK